MQSKSQSWVWFAAALLAFSIIAYIALPLFDA
jgi:hypothetical protein